MTVEQFSLDFTAETVCKCCREQKSKSDFAKRGNGNYRNVCKLCQNNLQRTRYSKNESLRQKHVTRNKNRIERLRESQEGRAIINGYKRRHRQKFVESGLTVDGTPRKQWQQKLTEEQLAVRKVGGLFRGWFRQWLNHLGPAPCVAAIYAATGKPWNNPRLTSAEKFAMRYELDTEFRAREIIKTQGRKAKRAALIAAQSDGTVIPKTLGALFAAAKDCCYCGAPMNWKQKTADHIVPLTQGGLHSMTNLAICCISCNSSKRDRTPEQWLTSGLQKSRWTALISSKQPTFSA
jgi:hypothetical protein